MDVDRWGMIPQPIPKHLLLALKLCQPARRGLVVGIPLDQAAYKELRLFANLIPRSNLGVKMDPPKK